MRILIVDDDKLIRFSLKSMLLDILPTDCFITEASDGMEMINRCNEYEPDIAFVDIRMPNMDGLSAIDKCKVLSPGTSFVVLTGYSDFEYAKKCIGLGISDYVLKPISPTDLSEIIEKCQQAITYKEQLRNNNFKLFIHDELHNLTTTQEERDTFSISEDSILLSCSIFIDCITRQIYSEINNRLLSSIKNFSNQLLSSNFLYSIDHASDGYLCAIFLLSKDEVSSITKKLEFICQSCHTPDSRIYLFLNENQDMNSFKEAIQIIDTNSAIRINFAPGKAIFLSHKDKAVADITFYNDMLNLINAFWCADEINLTHILNNICRTYQAFPSNCNIPFLTAYITQMLSITVDSSDFKSFMKSFVMQSDKMYENMNSKSSPKIDLIIDYVNHSYASDVSINTLADKFNLTPNYISKLFHEKTNMKFIDYVCDLRMKQAKHLLIEKPDLPLKEVAITVGYYSPRHFSNIFRKATSLSPSEYRKKYLS